MTKKEAQYIQELEAKSLLWRKKVDSLESELVWLRKKIFGKMSE